MCLTLRIDTIKPKKERMRMTIAHPLSAKQTISHLQAAKLRLYAYKSEGRFICRIADKSGGVISLSSCPTLEDAVTIAVEKTQA